MNQFFLAFLRPAWPLVALSLLALAGCGRSSGEVEFKLNLEGQETDEMVVERMNEQAAKLREEGQEEEADALDESIAPLIEERRAQRQTVTDGVTALFGTPDVPYDLNEFTKSGLDYKKLLMAAGPVSGDRHGQRTGLYREHCVHCHGISGDGAGHTALFLKPYPRDYRRGTFKFTSTSAGMRPTTEDLEAVLHHGVPGTAMPSFGLLPPDEIAALAEYVKYLAIRGETESLLRGLIVDEEEELTRDLLVEQVESVVASWNEAADEVVTPPQRTSLSDEQLAESIENGRKLFMDETVVKCVGCHGPTGLGDGGTVNYDDWNKPKSELSPEFVAETYALPVQLNQPRNLRLGVYRGGRRPLDIYRRIHASVKGSGMPNFGPSGGNPGTLTDEQIWSLVDYVMSLPYDPQSNPFDQQAAAHRSVN